MFINKIGSYHVEYGLNNQDSGFVQGNVKLVVDGCSDGLHSEVGAKLFCYGISKYLKGAQESANARVFGAAFIGREIERQIPVTIKSIVDAFGFNHTDIKNHLCFTILYVIELEDSFLVRYCGDGFIVAETLAGDIELTEISDGECPKYFAYNYVSAEHLTNYTEGVEFTTLYFAKSVYKSVGVASDGLRYIKGAEFYDEFIDCLKRGKESAVKRLINREHNSFKDDITIAF